MENIFFYSLLMADCDDDDDDDEINEIEIGQLDLNSNQNNSNLESLFLPFLTFLCEFTTPNETCFPFLRTKENNISK